MSLILMPPTSPPFKAGSSSDTISCISFLPIGKVCPFGAALQWRTAHSRLSYASTQLLVRPVNMQFRWTLIVCRSIALLKMNMYS